MCSPPPARRNVPLSGRNVRRGTWTAAAGLRLRAASSSEFPALRPPGPPRPAPSRRYNRRRRAGPPHSAGARRMCHARSHLHAMTGPGAPAPSTGPSLRRASGPEIFTFEPLPEPAGASPARLGPSRAHRKRSRRVLYPRVVRRQRPSEEPSVAKRALFLLLAVVFCQILMAEEGVSQPLAPEDAPGAASPEPTSAPPALAPLNLTSESSSDYALDLKAFLQQHPAAF